MKQDGTENTWRADDRKDALPKLRGIERGLQRYRGQMSLPMQEMLCGDGSDIQEPSA